MKIWIDADACPKVIKEVIFKAAERLKLPVILVANSQMFVPPGPLFQLIQVKKEADAADHYIAEHVVPVDLVITADIPLADRVVKTGATALNPRGEIYTEENISERLSMRDFLKEMRDLGGVITGGPEAFGPRDRELFTNALNRLLTQKLKP